MKQLNCRSATQFFFRCISNPHCSDPYQITSTDLFSYPSDVFKLHSPNSDAIKGGSGFTYHDQYMLRFTETYFLKAETYAGPGNTASTVADINLVRACLTGQ